MSELQSLIIQLPGTLSGSPVGTPTLPDLTTGLLLDFRVEDFPNLIDGAKPSQLISARGSANQRSRTWDENGSASGGWVMPTYHATGGPDGGPWLEFNGNCSMKNFDGFGNAAIVGNLTICFVYRMGSLPAGRTFGILCGVAADISLPTRLTVQAQPTQITIDNPPQSFGPSAPYSAAMARGEWGVLIVSMNGSNSLMMAGGVLTSGTIIAPSFKGLLVGRPGFSYDAGLPSFYGGLRAVSVFTRALSESEVRAEYALLRSRYGLN